MATLERIQAAFAGRYVIERELGRGGMATVYLAQDAKHDRSVAIKVLHQELAASIGSERFEREIRLAAKLQHPHILALYDSGEAGGFLFFVMPFVKGESLRDRLDRESQLGIDDAIQITLEVADALGYAHAQGIIHRDIKPENILLSNGHALVADFGIAKAATEGTGQKLTQTGVAIGTPVYMAPEQAVGEAVTATADIYSLGCMLYEMLAGEPPFTGKNAHAIMARHAMESVPSIRIIRNTVPEEIEDVIFASMAKTPADRPQTAAQFIEYFGLPAGATASRRVTLRQTASRRVPTMANTVFQTDGVAIPTWKKFMVPAIAGIAVGLTALAVWWTGSKPVPTSSVLAVGPARNRIAVLYFDDASRDKSLGYLADGVSEAIMSALGSVSTLKVISRAGVEQFRDEAVPTDSIAKILEAGTIVKGEVEPEGDKIRITVRLLDASGTAGEKNSFSLPNDNPLALRDSAAIEAASLIRKELGASFQLERQRASTSDRQAWSQYQRAEQIRRRGEAAIVAGDTATMSREFASADSLFGMVETLDSRWVDPIVARGQMAYRHSRQVGRDPLALEKWIGLAVGHADRALALDANSADALELRGTASYFRWLMRLETDESKAKALLLAAQGDLENATQRNATQAGAWATLSHLYNQTEGAQKVANAAFNAYQADAFLREAEQVLNRLFLASYDSQDFPTAKKWCDELNRRFPQSPQSPRCQLYLLSTKMSEPDVALGWRLADSAVALTPAPRRPYQRLNSNILAAAVIAKKNLKDSAERVVARSLGDADIDPVRDLAQWGAFVYTLTGNKAKAIDLLEIFLNANPGRRSQFKDDVSWWFKPLVDEPRFKQLSGGK